jgi:hypothetical protein
MNVQPIHGIPALRVDGAVVIGDLHIGVESHLGRKGFHLPSRTAVMRDLLLEIKDANRLVVLGDVKDSVPGSSKQEYREIPDFFRAMLEHFDVVDVVVGNHDTQIEEFLPKHVNVHPASGMKLGDVGFIHGHTWPSAEVMASGVLVTAHNHPAVMFRDGIGKRTTEPCWFRAGFTDVQSDYLERPDELVIIPAFNRLLGGSPVNVSGEGFLGPLMNSGMVNTDDARIFLLDGICLGRRRDVIVSGKERKYKE